MTPGMDPGGGAWGHGPLVTDYDIIDSYVHVHCFDLKVIYKALALNYVHATSCSTLEKQ